MSQEHQKLNWNRPNSKYDSTDTQQIATELHEKDDLIYRSPNKVLNPSK